MNTSQLKDYAPEARKAFIAAVSSQASRLGITAEGNTEAQVQGDVLLVNGQAFPKDIAQARKGLVDRVEAKGFEQTMEAIAYTWFNRFVAIRYMELHGYLDHGYRVLSHPEGTGRPEILDHATDIELPGLRRDRAIELKLDGAKDEELYRLLLLSQCNALHQAMPFLFEKLGDEMDLLLPANLLHTDSLIRQLVEQIDEALWQEIEIIGWLYQFYISEKKDQVIGKVVKAEDIPAATQLFTPNWIVKYMVQNSLGAQWLATYPHSPLKGQMDYYIEPAEQAPEVQQQLREITPTSLDPEELTLIDPACGSGHILVEAYDLFKAIYLERGYRQRDVPQLILERNLYGLDIDERAAQLTGFALMMKGQADDRRLFDRGVKLNVMAVVDSAGFDPEGLAEGVDLSGYGLKSGDLTELKCLFEYGTILGSLIQIPKGIVEKLSALKQLSEATSQDLFVAEAFKCLALLVQQAELLAARYDVVVMNPPYIARRQMTPILKGFIEHHFQHAKNDNFSAFIVRGCMGVRHAGRVSMVTMDSWMFLSSHAELRDALLRQSSITSLVHIGWNCFPEVHTYHRGAAFSVINFAGQERGAYLNLSNVPATVKKDRLFLSRVSSGQELHCRDKTDFLKIPGTPVAYWLSDHAVELFAGPKLGDRGATRRGLQTGDKEQFIRYWHECDVDTIERRYLSREESVESVGTWFYFNNGGDFRKWYGNLDLVVHWKRDGSLLKSFSKSIIPNEELYFQAAICWPRLTSGDIPFRVHPAGVIPGDLSPCFYSNLKADVALGYLNTPCSRFFIDVINPSVTTPVGDVAKIPFRVTEVAAQDVIDNVRSLVRSHHSDWNAFERSCEFQCLPFLKAACGSSSTLESSYTTWINQNRDTIAEMKRLEEENNRLFIDAYGLVDELTPEVPIEQITLTVNPAYRYGGKLTEEEQWTRFRQDAMQELASYAIGCMMGRYSLDASGLIYAHSGNKDFDPSRYNTFPADDDGIVPLTDTEWFDDDAAHGLVEFISVAWDAAHIEANLTFLADNLSPKKNESSRETLRRYFSDKFFKDHLQTYKKRPIYWLFSSGKQKAFQCLVYLHRYNEGTLSRIRTEYVIPLQGKMQTRIDHLRDDIAGTEFSSHQKKLSKERDKLLKQQEELRAFDEQLRHYADQRISLDLDDGVKVNYGKFGNLLAEVKAVTGKK